MIINHMETTHRTGPLPLTCSTPAQVKSSAAAITRQDRIRFLVDSARYLDLKLSRQDVITRFTGN